MSTSLFATASYRSTFRSGQRRSGRSSFTVVAAALWTIVLTISCQSELGRTNAVRMRAELDSASPPISDEDQRLEELTETYVNERLRFYPVESTLFGISGQDSRLGSFSRASINSRLAWLVDFHQRLAGLDPSELTKSAHVDALWLTSLVKAEILDLETRRPWANNASFYSETVREGLVSVLLSGELGDGLPALLSRLEAVPAVVDEARANLEPPSRLFREDGLRSVRVCLSLVESLPALLDGRILPASMETLRRVSSQAETSLRGLEDHVRSLPSGEESEATSSREVLQAFWRYRDMVDSSLEDIEERAEERLRAIDDEITALALAEFDGRPRRQLLSRSRLDVDVEVESLVGETLDRLRREVRARSGDATSNRADEFDPPSVRAVPPPFVFPDSIRLWRPATLEQASVLLVVAGGSSLESSMTSLRSPALDGRDLELLTLREGVARLRLHRMQSSARSLLRRLYAARTTAEGWLYLHSDRLLEEGVLGARAQPALRLRALHQRATAFYKLVGVLRYHRDGESVEGIEEMMRERGKFPEGVARSLANEVALDPGAGSAALGLVLLTDLARDQSRRFPLLTRRELEMQLVAEGGLPVALIRFHLMSSLPMDDPGPYPSEIGALEPGLRDSISGL